MKQILKPAEWKIYKALYIDNMSEEEAATLMGYRTNEKNRVPGYKQIKNVKKSHKGLRLFTCSIDKGLNKKKFIVPGLGDAGDRYMGT